MTSNLSASIPTPCCQSSPFRSADDAILLITESVERDEAFAFLLGQLRTFVDVYKEGWSLLDPGLAKYCIIGMPTPQSQIPQACTATRLPVATQGGGEKKNFDTGWDIFFGGDPP